MSTTTFLKVEVDEEMIEKLIISHVREKLEQIPIKKFFGQCQISNISQVVQKATLRINFSMIPDSQ